MRAFLCPPGFWFRVGVYRWWIGQGTIGKLIAAAIMYFMPPVGIIATILYLKEFDSEMRRASVNEKLPLRALETATVSRFFVFFTSMTCVGLAFLIFGYFGIFSNYLPATALLLALLAIGLGSFAYYLFALRPSSVRKIAELRSASRPSAS